MGRLRRDERAWASNSCLRSFFSSQFVARSELSPDGGGTFWPLCEALPGALGSFPPLGPSLSFLDASLNSRLDSSFAFSSCSALAWWSDEDEDEREGPVDHR